jgi:hypothetical protein
MLLLRTGTDRNRLWPSDAVVRRRAFPSAQSGQRGPEVKHGLPQAGLQNPKTRINLIFLVRLAESSSGGKDDERTK